MPRYAVPEDFNSKHVGWWFLVPRADFSEYLYFGLVGVTSRDFTDLRESRCPRLLFFTSFILTLYITLTSLKPRLGIPPTFAKKTIPDADLLVWTTRLTATQRTNNWHPHWTLQAEYYLFKLGLVDKTVCELCVEEDESAERILGVAVERIRFQTLGTVIIHLESYSLNRELPWEDWCEERCDLHLT